MTESRPRAGLGPDSSYARNHCRPCRRRCAPRSTAPRRWRSGWRRIPCRIRCRCPSRKRVVRFSALDQRVRVHAHQRGKFFDGVHALTTSVPSTAASSSAAPANCCRPAPTRDAVFRAAQRDGRLIRHVALVERCALLFTTMRPHRFLDMQKPAMLPLRLVEPRVMT